MIDPIILRLLACPCEIHGQIVEVNDHLRSLCCYQDFRIEDGIPVLLGKDS